MTYLEIWLIWTIIAMLLLIGNTALKFMFMSDESAHPHFDKINAAIVASWIVATVVFADKKLGMTKWLLSFVGF